MREKQWQLQEEVTRLREENDRLRALQEARDSADAGWVAAFEKTEAERNRLREALAAERKRCAQIVVDSFAPSQGEDMDWRAVEVLAALAKEAGQ